MEFDNQAFEAWLANPPEQYREIFQEIETVKREYTENLSKMNEALDSINRLLITEF